MKLRPETTSGPLRLSREAKSHLMHGDVEVDVPDLSCYDEFLGASP
jgi:hypothetical protein